MQCITLDFGNSNLIKPIHLKLIGSLSVVTELLLCISDIFSIYLLLIFERFSIILVSLTLGLNYRKEKKRYIPHIYKMYNRLSL